MSNTSPSPAGRTRNTALTCIGVAAGMPGLRLWGGATVEGEDMRAVLSWLDWAFGQVVTRAAA